MKKKLFIGVIIIALLIVGLSIYYKFGWRTYTDPTYKFKIQYPFSWKHEESIEKDRIWYRWYTGEKRTDGECRPMAKDGTCITSSLFLEIDKVPNKYTNNYQDYGNRGSMQSQLITIAGIKTKQLSTDYTLGGEIWIGPFEYNSKIYSFSGDNTEKVKKMLSTFRFTN